MRMVPHGRSGRSLLACFLAITLFSSPAEALRTMLMLRRTSSAAPGVLCVGARLRLRRSSPPSQVEATRPLVVRKSDLARPAAGFDRGARELGSGSPRAAALLVPWKEGILTTPSYLRAFLPSSPQHPLHPPAEPVLLAS